MKSNSLLSIRGEIDTTYHTQQRSMFASGLAAEIGVHAFAVWHAIKSHADFQTGVAWPGIRRLCELTGASDKTVQAAIKTLVAAHLLRVTKRGQKNLYVARERMDVRIGDRVICTIVVDFVPATMRDKLAKLKGAAAGEIEADENVWAHVELIPGSGLVLDAQKGTFKTVLKADEIPEIEKISPSQSSSSVAEDRKKLKELAREFKMKSKTSSRSSPAKAD